MRGLFAVSLILLAACQPTAGAAPGQMALPRADETSRVEQRATDPVSPDPTSPEASLAENGMAGPEPSPAPLPRRMQEERLLGLLLPDVQHMFGRPNLVRREGDAQVLQFGNGICLMDAYFYRAGTGDPFRLDHVDMRIIGVGDRQACLNAFFPDGIYPEQLLAPRD